MLHPILQNCMCKIAKFFISVFGLFFRSSPQKNKKMVWTKMTLTASFPLPQIGSDFQPISTEDFLNNSFFEDSLEVMFVFSLMSCLLPLNSFSFFFFFWRGGPKHCVLISLALTMILIWPYFWCCIACCFYSVEWCYFSSLAKSLLIWINFIQLLGDLVDIFSVLLVLF